MTERQDGNEHLCFLRLSCHFISNLEPVIGKINIHLVCSIELDMAGDLDVKLILTDGPLERRELENR